MSHRVLVINPGSTSTKVSLFDGDDERFSEVLRHSENEIARFPNIPSQYEFRMDVILDSLKKHGYDFNSIEAVVGRGGLLYPCEGGTYKVNEVMVKHLKEGVQGEHASNLGGLLAYAIGEKLSIPAFIVDPVVVDELEPVARLSGHPLLQRRSIFHALNQKAVARKTAMKLRKRYDEVNLIVVHMGGGISVGAHKRGRVVDVNNALNGDGPYTPERSGGLPAWDLASLCFSGNYDKDFVKKMIKGNGGLKAYIGTSDVRQVLTMMKDGDENAALYLDGMAYQIAKEIGMLAAVLAGDVDGIVLSGGIAYSEIFVDMIKNRVAFIAPVFVFPGEEEMEALAQGALRVLRGEEEAKEYCPKVK